MASIRDRTPAVDANDSASAMRREDDGGPDRTRELGRGAEREEESAWDWFPSASFESHDVEPPQTMLEAAAQMAWGFSGTDVADSATGATGSFESHGMAISLFSLGSKGESFETTTEKEKARIVTGTAPAPREDVPPVANVGDDRDVLGEPVGPEAKEAETELEEEEKEEGREEEEQEEKVEGGGEEGEKEAPDTRREQPEVSFAVLTSRLVADLVDGVTELCVSELYPAGPKAPEAALEEDMCEC